MAYQGNRRPTRGGAAGGGRSRFGGGGRSSGGGGRRGPRKENIHPSKFIKKAQSVEVAEYKSQHKFADFAVLPLLARNIAVRGFESPSPIQDQAIPAGLKGRDIIGIANTGTGKTVAFLVPVLNRLLSNDNSRVLIMAPTRELAQQILDECKIFAQGGNLNWAILIGGAPMRPQLRDLSRNPRIIIGTPGRIKDHMERGSLDLREFDTAVLDEVDRMLDMGFVQDMRVILTKLATERQSFFFSATMDTKVRSLINEFARDPLTISVKTGDTSDNVDQDIIHYRGNEEKLDKLHEVLIKEPDTKFLIFDETKRGVDRLSKELRERGFWVDSIHGDKSQGQRQRALNKFKENKINILVATDVAARGIDVPDITHVINYATPQSYSDYVHRVGRAGRAGRTGSALTFIEGSASSTNRPERRHTHSPRRRR